MVIDRRSQASRWATAQAEKATCYLETLMYGELDPVGGGDPIPLLKEKLLCGRRESCDIILRFSNVSSQHCKLELHSGYWYVCDLNSKNGTRVNDVRVTEKRLDPGDILRIAKQRYRVNYSPIDCGAIGPPPSDSMPGNVMQKSLLERAGLTRAVDPGPDGTNGRRLDLLNDEIDNV